MRKTLYFILFIAVLFSLFSCSEDADEKEKTLRQLYIDISDFTMYKGTPNGGEEVLFNDLKKSSLVQKYLSEVYKPQDFSNITLQFNNNKLTYIESKGSKEGIQIISDFSIYKDSLFLKLSDGGSKFIALIDSKNTYYRRSGLVSYPNSDYTPEDTTQLKIKQEALPYEVNMSSVLKLAGHESIEDLTNPEDTIIWCNVIYPFN